MAKYHQTSQELLAHLRDQIRFIVESAVSYDSGFEGEARRLAVAIRILVHDTTRSSALLAQLGKMKTLFYDSASEFDPENLLPSNCLTMVKMGRQEGEQETSAEYVAPLERLSPARSSTKRVGFERWWRRSIMYRDREGAEFTRRDLVLKVADQDGGAHVDSALDGSYANLSRFNTLGWKLVVHGEPKDFKDNPVPPSIRQIAHEVLKTLRNVAGEVFPSGDAVFDCLSEYEEHFMAVSSG